MLMQRLCMHLNKKGIQISDLLKRNIIEKKQNCHKLHELNIFNTVIFYLWGKISYKTLE